MEFTAGGIVRGYIGDKGAEPETVSRTEIRCHMVDGSRTARGMRVIAPRFTRRLRSCASTHVSDGRWNVSASRCNSCPCKKGRGLEQRSYKADSICVGNPPIFYPGPKPKKGSR